MNCAGYVFLDMLQSYAVPQIEGYGLIFQLFGAHPHFDCIVRESLNRNFLGRWVRRPGPWSHRYFDLTPLNFTFEIMSRKKVNQSITAEIQNEVGSQTCRFVYIRLSPARTGLARSAKTSTY